MKRIVKQMVLGLVAVLALGYASLVWLDYFTKHDEYVIVPDLQNKTIAEVESIILENYLRYEILDSGAYNPKFKSGAVIEQNPLASKKVKENRKIYLTLNPSNAGSVTIPNLRDKHLRRMVTFARATDLKIDRIEFKRDIANLVILGLKQKGKRIKAGEKVPKGSGITIVAGKKKGEKSAMPDVRLLNRQDGVDKLLKNGLNIGVVRYDESVEDEREAKIYKQNPMPSEEKEFDLGRGVNLWLTTDTTKLVIPEEELEEK